MLQVILKTPGSLCPRCQQYLEVTETPMQRTSFQQARQQRLQVPHCTPKRIQRTQNLLYVTGPAYSEMNIGPNPRQASI